MRRIEKPKIKEEEPKQTRLGFNESLKGAQIPECTNILEYSPVELSVLRKELEACEREETPLSERQKRFKELHNAYMNRF